MKLRYIDALRGIAIIAVIMVHTGLYGSNIYPSIIKNVISNGARGVQLFYIASAFTLFLSYNYRKEKERYHKRNFFIRRFFRIAPMYYIGIVYYLFQDGLGARYWLGDAESIGIGNVISNILFVHGVNPYWINSLVPGGWSITVEMTFYAFIPLLITKISNTNQAISFTMVSLFLSIVLNFIFHKFPLITHERLWNDYLFLYFPSQIAIFGLGIIAYFIIIKKNVKVNGKNLFAIFILFVSNLFLGIIPNHFTWGLVFFVLIISLSKYENVLLVNKLSVFFGKISYSGYLVHFAVLHWLAKYNMVDFIGTKSTLGSMLNFICRLMIVLFLTSAVSWVLLRIIEQPFQKLGRKYISKLEKEKITADNK